MTQGHSITVTPADLHVEVSVNGVKVAESDRPVLLEETGLPTRYYLPREDVRADVLSPTSSETVCRAGRLGALQIGRARDPGSDRRVRIRGHRAALRTNVGNDALGHTGFVACNERQQSTRDDRPVPCGDVGRLQQSTRRDHGVFRHAVREQLAVVLVLK